MSYNLKEGDWFVSRSFDVLHNTNISCSPESCVGKYLLTLVIGAHLHGARAGTDLPFLDPVRQILGKNKNTLVPFLHLEVEVGSERGKVWEQLWSGRVPRGLVTFRRWSFSKADPRLRFPGVGGKGNVSRCSGGERRHPCERASVSLGDAEPPGSSPTIPVKRWTPTHAAKRDEEFESVLD